MLLTKTCNVVLFLVVGIRENAILSLRTTYFNVSYILV